MKPPHASPNVQIGLPVLERPKPESVTPVVALVGNPNAGKTTVFNAFTGLRAKTANFPGTTVERRQGRIRLGSHAVDLIDLPGLYTVTGASAEERMTRDLLLGHVPGVERPAAVIVVLDATNVERNLYLVSQVLELGIRTVVALNMMDLAEKQNIRIDLQALRVELGCPVVPVSARTGRGMSDLAAALEVEVRQADQAPAALPERLESACRCSGCPYQARYDWAAHVTRQCGVPSPILDSLTEKIDRVLTHPVGGVVAFFAVMLGVFYLIFSLASIPMDLIDGLFGSIQSILAAWLPNGDFESLVVDGIVGGVGGVLVFLPQICILFFALSLLEDTGYLARAAFVMDRLMRRVGLPGKAFVPMLSAHACAIPAIMATRVIEDRRDRLVTILTLPLMTCSARLPVYTMVTALLFRNDPLKGALAFTAAYSLGITAALGMALVFKKTVLPGESRPLVIELPSYRMPGVKAALLAMLDRAAIFVKKAGTVILLISVSLWALATYPQSDPPAEVQSMRAQAAAVAGSDADQAGRLLQDADMLEARSALEHSFAGRLGHAIEPLIRPLGYDWQIGVGIISSFAAREVIVSTLSIIYGVGEDAEAGSDQLLDSMRKAKREDGSPVFTAATCASLLAFFVLAMQCLPTQAVTRRETGSWKWAALQLGYMTVLAYGVALVTYQVTSFFI